MCSNNAVRVYCFVCIAFFINAESLYLWWIKSNLKEEPSEGKKGGQVGNLFKIIFRYVNISMTVLSLPHIPPSPLVLWVCFLFFYRTSTESLCSYTSTYHIHYIAACYICVAAPHLTTFVRLPVWQHSFSIIRILSFLLHLVRRTTGSFDLVLSIRYEERRERWRKWRPSTRTRTMRTGRWWWRYWR